MKFNTLLKTHGFVSTHRVEDSEGVYQTFSNGVYELRYYWDGDTTIYPYKDGQAITALGSLKNATDFSKWDQYFSSN